MDFRNVRLDYPPTMVRMKVVFNLHYIIFSLNYMHVKKIHNKLVNSPNTFILYISGATFRSGDILPNRRYLLFSSSLSRSIRVEGPRTAADVGKARAVVLISAVALGNLNAPLDLTPSPML